MKDNPALSSSGSQSTMPGSPPDDSARSTSPALPPEATMSMPRQQVHSKRAPLRARPTWWHRLTIWTSRLFVAAVSITLTAYGIREMYGVLSTTSITLLQWLFLALFAINFSWISFAFSQALLGFLCGLLPTLGKMPEHEGELPFQTAVLVPVYNEEPARIAAAIKAMRSGLEQLAPGRFAFFILSDTNRAEAWIHEENTFRHLAGSHHPGCPVYYRRRSDNAERKAGNIADWVQRWGGDFEAMTVLDADSIVSPEALVTLSRRLAAAPGIGLIQTLPDIVRARSLYGRLQQFANQCYGPIYARGLAAWHGASSNFWGHNAIIRTRAFAESCGLPLLHGAPPFGGHILSHDFIEAALLRRAGWGVRFDCDIKHSYEEAPPSLIDVMVRDRRWCQGNLQHSRLLLARGLTPATRIHLLSGILSYLSAVMWLALVVLGLAIAVQASLVRPEYFAQPSLFPTWPVFDAERARWLFGVSMLVILAPKWFGGVLALLNFRRCLGFGGPLLLPLSLLLEILLSALYAPVLMLAQTHVVWSVLRGRDAGWQPQSRDDGALSWGTACRAHWGHTTFGAALATIAWVLNPALFLWLLPITAGLVLAIPLSWLSGGDFRGRIWYLCGLLRAPQEKRPCDILQAVEEALHHTPQEQPEQSALLTLARDASLCRWHLAQLAEPPLLQSKATFVAAAVTGHWKARHCDNLAALEDWLTPPERLALANSPEFVATLTTDQG